MTTVATALRTASEKLGRGGLESPRLQARQLLAKVTGRDAVQLYQAFQDELPVDQIVRFNDLVERRAAGEPLYYLVGHTEFYGRAFVVDGRVLVPRPETEELVEHALAYARRRAASPNPVRSVLDVGTGSGVLALTLAGELPDAQIVAVDRSEAALEVARINRARLGLERRVTLVQTDLAAGIDVRADLVVANLPYVPSSEIDRLQAEVRREPRLALDGGADGLSVYRRFFKQAAAVLAAPGLLMAEIGADQGAEALRLTRLAMPAALSEIQPDSSGRDRFIVVEKQ